MCECNHAEELAAINAKLDYIISTVAGTIDALAQNPMLKAFLR